MFQPKVKLEFVRRYLHPEVGWDVFVDIDPSEEGRTGSERATPEAKRRQEEMLSEARVVRREFAQLGVTVGGSRTEWCGRLGLVAVDGDRDIVAIHRRNKLFAIVEVEGISSGQPESKLYKAIGQIVVATGVRGIEGFERKFFLAVHGAGITRHLSKAAALARLGVSGVSIGANKSDDRWLFGTPISFGAMDS